MSILNRMAVCLAVLSLVFCCGITFAEDDKPLLIPNKKNLYQRILSLPGAKLFPHEELSHRDSINLRPFSIGYVYDRVTDRNDVEWLQIGFDRNGNRVGWIRADKTLEWNQGLTLTFRKPINHDRVLFFDKKQSVEQLVAKYDIARYERLYEAAIHDEKTEDSPVVAVQPATGINIRKHFYLLPIHDYEDLYLNGSPAKLLQVSSVPFNDTADDENKRIINRVPQNIYSAGIVFVIDSTLSMQPYINRTRLAVRKIFERLQRDEFLRRINFGLVAFRDNPSVSPGIKYLTRQFVSLKEGADGETFMRGVKNLRAAITTTKGFVEDSYAGVKQTLDGMDWLPHEARYIILITDAGARDGDDPLSGTGLDAVELNKLALEKNVAIFVLHLLTPDKHANHDYAAKQYRQLSYYPEIGSLYYGVPAGNLKEFGTVVDGLAEQIATQIQQAGGKNVPTVAAKSETNKNQRFTKLRDKVAKLGYALRLRYLQENYDESAPGAFNAWLLDKDFRNPEIKTLDVCVLLTRDQLSDLHGVLSQVLDTAEQGLISPQNFIDELKSIAATTARDPEQLGLTTATTTGSSNSLADMGFLREYIEDLPYTGEVMNLALDDWQSWSSERQVQFLQRLEEKVSYYRALHDHTDLWISLEGGAIDGNSVYPIPLDMLP